MNALDLSDRKKLKGATHWTVEINQLYRPTRIFGQDSKDIVYSFNNINNNKFTPLLLKEWFYLTKVNGFLVIDYLSNKFCDYQALENNMWWLWKNNYEIIFHGNIKNSEVHKNTVSKLAQFIINKQNLNNLQKGYLRFVCKKINPTKIVRDNINSWTFGIITNGLRPEWVEKMIQSIRQQKIPNLEIIVCGTYLDKNEKDFKYIPFSERDSKGWLSRKKNLIIKEAKYENICIIHDRFVLDKDWFKGMQKWGNCFEHLTCPQIFDNHRVNDWVARHFTIYDSSKLVFSFGSHVDYRDWYQEIIIQGQLSIFKKNIILKNNLWFDETIFKYDDKGGGEDFAFCESLSRIGFIPRINPFSKVYSLTYKEVDPTFIKFNPQSEIPHTKYDNFLPIMKLLSYLLLKVLYFFHLKPPYNLIRKARKQSWDILIRLTPERRNFYNEWLKVSGTKN